MRYREAAIGLRTALEAVDQACKLHAHKLHGPSAFKYKEEQGPTLPDWAPLFVRVRDKRTAEVHIWVRAWDDILVKVFTQRPGHACVTFWQNCNLLVLFSMLAAG